MAARSRSTAGSASSPSSRYACRAPPPARAPQRVRRPRCRLQHRLDLTSAQSLVRNELHWGNELPPEIRPKSPSPPFRGEREGPGRDSGREGEVGSRASRRALAPPTPPSPPRPGGGGGKDPAPLNPLPTPTL